MVSNKEYQDTLNACYQLYCFDWCCTHLTKEEVTKTIVEYNEAKDNYEDDYTILNYINDFGFHNECFVCKNEFEHAEFKDTGYMMYLLANHAELFETWMDIIREKVTEDFI